MSAGEYIDRLRRELEGERDSARAIVRVLAHAYTTDNQPPAHMVAEALAFPVFPAGTEKP